MKKIVVLISFLSIFGIVAQAQTKWYATSGGEMIFSFATIDNNGVVGGNIIRWSPVFNIQVFGNADFNEHIGLLFGGAIRNVGFIYDVPGTDESGNSVKMKYRNYNFALPVGLKIGNLSKVFLFGGYEIEFPFHYRERTFINNVRQDNIISTWFSQRTPAFYNSFFAGVQFPGGVSLKFKYYTSEFFNQDFTESNGNQPYKGFKANVWYLSLSFNLFRNSSFYYKSE